MSSSVLRLAGAGCVALVLVGCAVKKEAPSAGGKIEMPPPPKTVACTPVPDTNPLVGTWYSVSTPRGVSGSLQSLTVLSADGKMTYQTQLKIGRQIRPALREAGCWTYANGVYTMQTTQSNGEPVDVADPIYHNRYRVENVGMTRLVMRELKPNGQAISATKMAPNYRLP